MALPPCGLYRTRRPIGAVPEGRLVYFHNHGDPGPGIYLPERWEGNRARFSSSGTTLPSNDEASALEPLAREGFYRVRRNFHCCAKQCREFVSELLVQLGYDGAGQPILFVPELIAGRMETPERGLRIDEGRIAELAPLVVASRTPAEPGHDLGPFLH
jgi:hypothetical protein